MGEQSRRRPIAPALPQRPDRIVQLSDRCGRQRELWPSSAHPSRRRCWTGWRARRSERRPPRRRACASAPWRRGADQKRRFALARGVLAVPRLTGPLGGHEAPERCGDRAHAGSTSRRQAYRLRPHAALAVVVMEGLSLSTDDPVDASAASLMSGSSTRAQRDLAAAVAGHAHLKFVCTSILCSALVSEPSITLSSARDASRIRGPHERYKALTRSARRTDDIDHRPLRRSLSLRSRSMA